MYRFFAVRPEEFCTEIERKVSKNMQKYKVPVKDRRVIFRLYCTDVFTLWLEAYTAINYLE